MVSKLTDANGNFPFPVVSSQQAGLSGNSILPTHQTYFGGDHDTTDLGLRHELALNPSEALNRLAIFELA